MKIIPVGVLAASDMIPDHVKLLDRSTIAIIAAILCLGSLMLFWPGYAGFDAIDQYQQAMSGRYNDWHPPAMARLWSILHQSFGGVTAPMFAIQILSYWFGLGLFAAALVRERRPGAGLVILTIGAFPPFLGWQVEVLKDSQMIGALVAAMGLVATYRLRGVRMPRASVAAVIVLIGYGTLVRGNGAFATVPLAVMLVPRLSTRWRIAIASIAIVIGLFALPIFNQHVLGAAASRVQRSQPIFDLAGIAMNGGDGTGLTRSERAAIRDGHCYKPYFWDPLGHARRCGPALSRLMTEPMSALISNWMRAIVQNPTAYLQHRTAHLNATERLIVPRRWLRGAPATRSWQPGHDTETTADDFIIAEPGPLAKRFQYLVGRLADTPLCWPIFWVALALTGLCALRKSPAGPVRALALALLVSALALDASFVVLSISSPLRYHLWPMLATALAFVLFLSERAGSPRVWMAGGLAVTLVIATGTAARLILPPASKTYSGMLQ